jgi:hypothetical protein
MKHGAAVTGPGAGTPDTSVSGLLKFIAGAKLPIWADASPAVKGWSPRRRSMSFKTEWALPV